MAHHQQTGADRVHASQDSSLSSTGLRATTAKPSAGEDDVAAELDEPPDQKLSLARMISARLNETARKGALMMSATLQQSRQASLLTQALLTPLDLTPASDSEAPALSSDASLTSPARTTTPSPSLPFADNHQAVDLMPKDFLTSKATAAIGESQLAQGGVDSDKPVQEANVENDLGRRRCITFACGKKATAQTNGEQSKTLIGMDSEPKEAAAVPTKRPCMLRFACPFKPSRDSAATETDKAPSAIVRKPRPHSAKHESQPKGLLDERRQFSQAGKAGSKLAIKPSALPNTSETITTSFPKHPKPQDSEATRFHEFAGSFDKDDEWIHDQTIHAKKITVNDTLRKENAIRKLAEEAEEEAEEEAREDDEDEAEEIHLQGQGDPRVGNGRDDDTESLDDGNESDNEEGFADSDDESDFASDYQFWTPGLTTAATSTDHFEHIRPVTERVMSESSFDSMDQDDKHGVNIHGRRTSRHYKRSPRMRPGTPELPDSTDFVCGTLDEDRPLEAAYVSCREERRRSRHHVVPQDIDPSFPTSEPEESEDEDDDAPSDASNEPMFAMGSSDDSQEETLTDRRSRVLPRKTMKSPMPSPKRLRSPPPPPKRANLHHSPPARRLFGQSPHRHWSLAHLQRRPDSPPSTRQPSPDVSSQPPAEGFAVTRLAQRPHLTHTTSLPKTPNPFWRQHRQARGGSDIPSAGTSPSTLRTGGQDLHSRGPIDIFKGLENKRQRRKEKYWRQHCRNAGRDKDRRCQPGKGAERMKELGLEMAGKGKGLGQNPNLMLSI